MSRLRKLRELKNIPQRLKPYSFCGLYGTGLVPTCRKIIADIRTDTLAGLKGEGYGARTGKIPLPAPLLDVI